MDRMTNPCLNPERLLRYHLGALRDEEQERIDDHLLACAACLQASLRLRRALLMPPAALAEDRADEDLRPSPAARERLRAAVAQRFRPSPGQRLRRLLQRPLPLYQAAALLVLVLGGVWAARPAPRPVSPEVRLVPVRDASARCPAPDIEEEPRPARRPRPLPRAAPELYLEAVDTSLRSALSPVVL